MREADIQNLIRLELSKQSKGVYFRGNTGMAWTGDSIEKQGSTVIIRNARPFRALQSGFSDIFGMTTLIIQEKHIGQQMGIFTAIEVKNRSKVSEDQKNFLKVCEKAGSLCGVAYNQSDAIEIVERFL